MFRRHGNAIGGPAGSGILGELASFEINGDEAGLVQIEPKAELIAPTRIETVIDEEESDAEKDDAE